MANAREIQSRMKSIQDTMKITNAMYLISSTKLKKARKNLEDTEPYFYTLQCMINRIIRHLPDGEDHPYFTPEKEPEEKKRGYIVVTADKGLAGAYNHNVLKIAQEQLKKGKDNKLFVVGEAGRQYFAAKGIAVETHFHYTAQNPTMHRARVISGEMLELYRQKQLDEIYIIYTKMLNGVQTEAEIAQLLPLKKQDFGVNVKLPLDVYREEFVFWPSVNAVLDNVIPNYINGFIYGALVESFSSEQNNRMMAMEAANNSANDMLKQLSILYNRVRQAAITQEITEVISGAKAQKKKKENNRAGQL